MPIVSTQPLLAGVRAVRTSTDRSVQRPSISAAEPKRGGAQGGGAAAAAGPYRVTRNNDIKRPVKIDLPGLHPSISAVAGGQFAQSHYDSGIFDAFKAVENRVQSLPGSKQSGKSLMTSVFNEQNPRLATSAKAAGSPR
ncbi:TIGR02391 family protein [Nocardia sp. CA-084685]|uniref:TIGR02391 family protein n=1 Tax=Nocardia sp. CA-084685 TaxID=3239970 RepID=UPI003D958DCA